MSKGPVLRVEELGKCFEIYRNPSDRLVSWISGRRWRAPKKFWALKDVSFELYPGQFFGVIGANGAGKSTLLRAISGVLRPTEGSYTCNGVVLSLLELGVGLNLDLTGRENCFRTAELLGFPRGFVESRIDQIEEFAELGDFFGRPVRFYSTGMKTRLAFSMFAFLDCDVLILDEVLAVGDVFFRQKCFQRLDELIAQNVAIVLVSHNLGIIKRYCDQVLVLSGGRALFQGKPSEAVREYVAASSRSRTSKTAESLSSGGLVDDEAADANSDKTTFLWPKEDAFVHLTVDQQRSSGRYGRITRFAVCDANGQPAEVFRQGDPVFFHYEFELAENIDIPVAALMIRDQHNLLVHSKSSLQAGVSISPIREVAHVRISQSLELGLAPGPYTFGFFMLGFSQTSFDSLTTFSAAELSASSANVGRLDRAGEILIAPRQGERPPTLHGGLTDLPGLMSVRVESSDTKRNAPDVLSS